MLRWIRAYLAARREARRPRCPRCGHPVTITTRLMGDVVPYEWIECPCASGWGARL